MPVEMPFVGMTVISTPSILREGRSSRARPAVSVTIDSIRSEPGAVGSGVASRARTLLRQFRPDARPPSPKVSPNTM